MVLFSFIWFSILYSSTFFLSKSADVFAPLKFVSVKHALINLPFLFYITLFPNHFVHRILEVCNVTLNEAFYKYTLVQTVAFIALAAAILLFNKYVKFSPPPAKTYSYKTVTRAAIIFMALGLAGYGIFLFRIGGISVLIDNLSNRVALQSGQYVLMLLPFLTLSSVCLLYAVKLKNNVLTKILFAVSVIVTVAVNSSFGARKNTLLFIIVLIVAAYYYFNIKFNRKIFIGAATLFVLLAAYIMFVPLLRKDNLDRNSAFSAQHFIYSTSYTFIDVFAANYFNKDNAWYLKGYFDPVKVITTNKSRDSLPQVDQGVYFNTIIVEGRYVAPPIPRSKVTRASWPTENFGFAYANFLLPGVIVFFFLLGLIYAFMYRLLIADFFNPVLITLYILVMFSFDFSSLRIAANLKLAPVILIAYLLLKFLKSDVPKHNT